MRSAPRRVTAEDFIKSIGFLDKQGFFVFVTYGVGMLIGAQVAGNVYNRFLGGVTALTLDQWRSFWFLPAGFAAVVLVFFGLAFYDREVEARRRAGLAAAENATPAGP